MKSIIAAGLLLGSIHGAAQAGPFLNVETNSGFTGSDYTGSATDMHLGYEGSNWSIQAGPTVVSPDNAEGSVELSGKASASLPVNDALSVYGEVSFITADDDNGYGTKLGAKYNF
jgi:hypothetical protein